uniref:Uncharacterized protein n=1 Tax=Anguilla anguilla TaxID=7936 RepID=A0A0E9RN88_ANGAN
MTVWFQRRLIERGKRRTTGFFFDESNLRRCSRSLATVDLFL